MRVLFTSAALILISLHCWARSLDKDVVYDKVGSVSLKMDVYRPEDLSKTSAPALIYIHGGCFYGGSKSDIPDYLQNLTQEGVVVFSLDYRLSGVALYPAGVTDIQQAVRFIRKNAERFHIDAQKIIVHGESAGGYLAAALGVQPMLDRHGKTDSFSSRLPVVSEWFGRMDFTVPQEKGTDCAMSFLGKERTTANLPAFIEASILPKLNAQTALFHVIQGTDDKQVYPIQSALLANRLWNLDKKIIFTLAEGEHHGFQGGTPWLLTHRFLQEQWQLLETPRETKKKVSLGHAPGEDFVVKADLPAGVYAVDVIFTGEDFKQVAEGTDIFNMSYETPATKKKDPVVETPVLINFDPVQSLANQKEVHRQFQVISKSDSLRFRFQARHGQAVISRIEIQPLP